MAEGQLASPEAAPPIEPLVPDGTLEPVKPEPKTYTQEDLDRIVNKVKKNARYQTKKEVEAFYQGRDSRPEPKPQTPTEDRPPERSDFASYEEFLEAKAVHSGGKAAAERIAKERSEAKTREAAEASSKTLNAFQSKVQEKYPDIEDRLEAISDIEMPAGALQAIAESDLGPDILSHLADNPKECQRIAALSPLAAIREIGKLESKLEAKPEPKKTTSKAPTPINPGGGGSPVDDTPQDTDTMDEWIRKERARERKRAGA